MLRRLRCAGPRSARSRSATTRTVLMAHGGGGRLTQMLIEGMFVQAFANPALSPLHDGADAGGGRRAAGLLHRLLRRPPALLPRRRHRLAGRARHRQRPGDVRRPAARASPPGSSSRRASRWPTSGGSSSRCAAPPRPPACRSSRATPRWSTAARATASSSTPPASAWCRPGSTSPPRAPAPATWCCSPARSPSTASPSCRSARGSTSRPTLRERLGPAARPWSTRSSAAGGDVHVLRDPTRGGVASALNEIAARGPGRHPPRGARPSRSPRRCAAPARSSASTRSTSPTRASAWRSSPPRPPTPRSQTLRAHPLGREAAIVGEVVDDHPGKVLLKSRIGGLRVVDMLSGEQLPRIC